MATPRCVKLNKHIFVFIEDDLFEVFTNKHFNWFTVPILRDFFRVEMLLQLAFKIILSKLRQVFNRQLGEVGLEFINSFRELRIVYSRTLLRKTCVRAIISTSDW